MHPSRKQTPVLFQASIAKAQSVLASKYAKAIFLNSFGTGTRMPITGRTKEEAEENHKTAIENADPVARLAQCSGCPGIDLASFPLDGPMNLSKVSQAMTIQVVFNTLTASENEAGDHWTPRRFGMRMTLGGLHPCPVGMAKEVADVMQQ
ncbi:hypothetical protein F5Y16DRAFT_393878 [Xylariaceae sp. FL0255]|nr:hypothetical protein F5Y16DRAFT_393878 [Xylariaceae sp. FL0255]